MVDLRGKPPYLPKKMSYTDVLKKAIDNGLRHFGYETDEWVDGQAENSQLFFLLIKFFLEAYNLF